GIVTNAPIRKTASIAIVKTTRRRSSGTLVMFANPARALIGRSSRSFRRGRGLCDRDEDRLASGLGDLLLSALRERMSRDRDRLGQVALTEDLDAVGAALDDAALT